MEAKRAALRRCPMSKPIPTVRAWMTTSPRAIEADASLNDAHQIMRDEGFRHLPVLEHGRLLGIVSQRDLHLIETLRDVDPDAVTVREAMVSHPYFVEPDAPLDGVVAEMAEHRFGAAVVMEESKVVGMFTTVDALRAFGELLKSGAARAGEAREEVAAPLREVSRRGRARSRRAG
jgi:acetoin utilization protein AcuB